MDRELPEEKVVSRSSPHGPRPRQRDGLVAFPVADEMVLLPSSGELVYALNDSGRAVWKLCDGRHTPTDMLRELRNHYDGDDIEVMADLSALLLRFQHLDLIDTAPARIPGEPDGQVSGFESAAPDRPRVRFLCGIEDTAYFHWQLAILFESMVGKLPNGWDIVVVVCNDNAALSKELIHLLDTYGVFHLTGRNHGRSEPIDLAGGGVPYSPLNKVEALRAVAGYVDADDLVCLIDTDLFLYGELQVDLFPRGNAMASNWIVAEEPFFGFAGEGQGVELQKVLESLGCTEPLKPGGVTVFLTGATLANEKFVNDCFRFCQILFLLGKIADIPPHGVYVSEMACVAMALTPNGIDYELLDAPQFLVPDAQCDELPEGTFFHYYIDFKEGAGPFRDSRWHKQLFNNRNFLDEDLDSFIACAASDLEKSFLDTAKRASLRLKDGADE